MLTACLGCAGPEQVWPKADFATTCKVIDLADLRKTPDEELWGPPVMFLRQMDVAVVTSRSLDLLSNGMSHESVSRYVSSSSMFVRFIDRRTLLVVGLGDPSQASPECVWVVRL